MNTQELTGRTIIVTGGGRGLGREMAYGLAKKGANVCIAAHIEEDINRVSSQSKEMNLGKQLYSILADLRDPEDCRRVVEKTISHFGDIFGLINNAALTFTYSSPNRYKKDYSNKFYELSDEVVQNVLDTNFIAADRMARLITPHLIKNKVGRLINVTTRLETMTKPGASPYGPSKAALENASEVWVKDLEGTGITVNIVNPGGAADTEGFEISEDRELAGKKVGGMVAPYKMVAPVCWLMSEQASQITGMRFDAIHWDENNSPEEEAKRIGRPLGFFLK